MTQTKTPPANPARFRFSLLNSLLPGRSPPQARGGVTGDRLLQGLRPPPRTKLLLLLAVLSPEQSNLGRFFKGLRAGFERRVRQRPEGLRFIPSRGLCLPSAFSRVALRFIVSRQASEWARVSRRTRAASGAASETPAITNFISLPARSSAAGIVSLMRRLSSASSVTQSSSWLAPASPSNASTIFSATRSMSMRPG